MGTNGYAKVKPLTKVQIANANKVNRQASFGKFMK